MDLTYMEWIYDSLMGNLLPEAQTPGVENAFEQDSACARLYERIYAANQRLCLRLGVTEDRDVEEIIDCFFEITRTIGTKMYEYGKDPHFN